jgi:ADP-heptose:LPS heptosyltransferase
VQRCARADMKILLIRLRLIGDVVFTTPLIRAL